MLYAFKYPGSKQIIFRRTFRELEKSIIRTALTIYPKELFRYNSTQHMGIFANRSILDFGYIGTENDVHQYQSAEYDVIRFDELTHFTEYMYVYLISRLRGANNFPKQMKSSTNPGNVGHAWVKERFINVAPANTVITTPQGTRRFIPSKVQDNMFLMEKDPDYLVRLENLPEEKKRALLYGDWDVFEGQYFAEFRREKHVIKPFDIPSHWKRFRSMDWGFNDPCCVLWHAVDTEGRVYTYRELYIRQKLARDVAEKILEISKGEQIRYTVASPDMWQKRGLADINGESIAETFATTGVPLIKADNSRVIGWQRMREYMADAPDRKPLWQIVDCCQHLIRTLPDMIYDQHNKEDIADGLEDHAPEAARYGLMSRPAWTKVSIKHKDKYYDPLAVEEKKTGGFIML